MTARGELTRLLKQAERTRWIAGYAQPMPVTFGYIHRYPDMFNPGLDRRADMLRESIEAILRDMPPDGLTDYQRRRLNDIRLLDPERNPR